MLYLPLAHVFARIVQVACVTSRVRLGHTSDVNNLGSHLSTFRPTFILSVPQMLEKVFTTARQAAHADGNGTVFDEAAEIAIAWSRARGNGSVGLSLRMQHAKFDLLVYRRLRAALGGKIEYAVSGGAPLDERLGHFFHGIGVPVLEGYGLTETTAALTVNLPGNLRIGTVGRPLPGVTVRVDGDGELLFNGGQVMAGYWNDDDATAAAIDADGWFHSGDLGEVRLRRLHPDHRPEEGDPGHRGRQERRARRARGPGPAASAGQPAAWSSATAGRSSRHW